jgi:hypothetical protein
MPLHVAAYPKVKVPVTFGTTNEPETAVMRRRLEVTA